MTTHVLHSAALGDVSKALQTLHQHLLRFEAEQSGFAGSPLQLFDRAVKDSGFAWLKPLREDIVALDERRAGEDPISEAEATRIGEQFLQILNADTGPFRDRLNDAIQARPEVIRALGTLRSALNTLS